MPLATDCEKKLSKRNRPVPQLVPRVQRHANDVRHVVRDRLVEQYVHGGKLAWPDSGPTRAANFTIFVDGMPWIASCCHQPRS